MRARLSLGTWGPWGPGAGLWAGGARWLEGSQNRGALFNRWDVRVQHPVIGMRPEENQELVHIDFCLVEVFCAGALCYEKDLLFKPLLYLSVQYS